MDVELSDWAGNRRHLDGEKRRIFQSERPRGPPLSPPEWRQGGVRGRGWTRRRLRVVNLMIL